MPVWNTEKNAVCLFSRPIIPPLLMDDFLASGCGNVVSNGGGPASDGNVGCNMVCAGNASEICGGPNRLDVYHFGGGLSCGDPAGSLIQNGGFECGISPWQQQIVAVATAGLISPGHNSQSAYAVDQTGTPD